MSTRKKRHLIAGTIIGGLLLAATIQTGNSFALSDTSSPSTTGAPSTTQQTTTTPTDNSSPTTPTDSTASGSTATQSTATTAASSAATTTDPSTVSSPTTPVTTGPSTDPTNTNTANTTTATNTVDSTANTGDASVKHTADGGNAATGNAGAGTTLINTIASSSNLNSGTLQTFNYNIDGTQNGNVVINPNDILSSANTTSPTTPANCAPTGTTTADNNATINNLVTLLAQSGDAKVSDNGVGGDATSGNATTEANIINTIQGLVSDKGAFLGVINVNGDLNGNIELPASVINALLTPTTGETTGSTTATNNDTINNNVTLTAISGNAAVINNGAAGTAISGNAETILQDCNLINSNISGGNLLLVFVNVMGHWYGALLSEPTGDTTATLGGGITQDTVSPSQQTTATNNSTITNDVNLTSITGNASIANNGVGGNATTGNATAIADITNILGSQINLTGWLGILVINVFGTWDGSLVIQPTGTTTPTISSNDIHTQSASNHTAPVDLGNGSGYYIANPPQSFDAGQYNLASDQVLGANTSVGNSLSTGVRQTAAKTNHTQSTKRVIIDYILAGIGIMFAITGGASRFFASRRNSL